MSPQVKPQALHFDVVVVSARTCVLNPPLHNWHLTRLYLACSTYQCVARNGSGDTTLPNPNVSESAKNVTPVRERSANAQKTQCASPGEGGSAQLPLGALFPSPRQRRSSRPRSKLSHEGEKSTAEDDAAAAEVVQSPGMETEDLPSTKRGRVSGEEATISTWLRPQSDRPAFGFVSFLPTAPPVAPRPTSTATTTSDSSNGSSDNNESSDYQDVDAPYWDKVAEARADGNYAGQLAPNSNRCALESAPPSFAGVGSVVVIDRYNGMKQTQLIIREAKKVGIALLLPFFVSIFISMVDPSRTLNDSILMSLCALLFLQLGI